MGLILRCESYLGDGGGVSPSDPRFPPPTVPPLVRTLVAGVESHRISGLGRLAELQGAALDRKPWPCLRAATLFL